MIVVLLYYDPEDDDVQASMEVHDHGNILSSTLPASSDSLALISKISASQQEGDTSAADEW